MLPFSESVTMPLRCGPSDLTNPFVLPGVFAGLGWISPMLIAVVPIFGARALRRAPAVRFKLWLRPALRWLATVLITLAVPILIADGWNCLQALHYIPWCIPPGAFSDVSRNAQLARVDVAGVLGLGGLFAGICLTSLGSMAVIVLMAIGRNGRIGPGPALAARMSGGA